MKDSRSRKWQITINNPQEKGFTHEKIKELIKEFKSLVYWCMSDEVGENGTYHTHLYLHNSNALRFSTLKKRFEGAHFEMASGTASQNKDYVFKEGKWLDDKKADTNLRDTHEEGGDVPIERQGQRNDLIDLYDMIKAGFDNYSIIEENPNFMFDIDKIERARQVVKENEYRKTFRNLHVTYVYGRTKTGKTRSVMEKYGYENVYRVTDYDHPFDGYKGQDVLVFEEFRSSLKVQDMLNYLDGYPLELPCRYANKVACFTKVYIITNISLNDQYSSVQRYQGETWQALLRRINEVKVFNSSEDVKIYDTDEYVQKYAENHDSSNLVHFEQKNSLTSTKC